MHQASLRVLAWVSAPITTRMMLLLRVLVLMVALTFCTPADAQDPSPSCTFDAVQQAVQYELHPLAVQFDAASQLLIGYATARDI
eukprot:COSAG05_NODE_257_length_12748_cov_68.067120_6_plen_85_part_00